LEKCAKEAKKYSASETTGNSDEEEEKSKTNKRQYMDEATRKREVNDLSFTLISVK